MCRFLSPELNKRGDWGSVAACAAPLPHAAGAGKVPALGRRRVGGRAGAMLFSRQKDPRNHHGLRSDVSAALADRAAYGPGATYPETYFNVFGEDLIRLRQEKGLPVGQAMCTLCAKTFDLSGQPLNLAAACSSTCRHAEVGDGM